MSIPVPWREKKENCLLFTLTVWGGIVSNGTRIITSLTWKPKTTQEAFAFNHSWVQFYTFLYLFSVFYNIVTEVQRNGWIALDYLGVGLTVAAQDLCRQVYYSFVLNEYAVLQFLHLMHLLHWSWLCVHIITGLWLCFLSSFCSHSGRCQTFSRQNPRKM